MLLLYCATAFLSLSYLIIIQMVNKGLKNLIKTNYNCSNTHETTFSIIVSARNEENYIGRLLNSLVQLNYPKEKFELIIVDDRSTDKTAKIIQSFQTKIPNLILIKQVEKLSAPKKSAIAKAIFQSKYDVIVTTDADCIIKKNFLSILSTFYENNYDVVAGPVEYIISDKSTFWQKVVAIDFLSLISFGAGFIGTNFPIICNGANFSYRKKCFNTVDGFKHIDNVASGDDDLLLHKFHKENFKITYSWHPNSIVETENVHSLNEFYEQRKRWGSKGASYQNLTKQLIMFSIFLFYFSFIFLIIHPYYFLTLFVSKILIELPVMLKTNRLFKNSFFWYFIPIMTAIQIPYIIFIGVMSNLRPHKWK